MNWFLFSAGILTMLAALVHTFVGERTDIRHLLASDVPMNEKVELRGIWHTFSIALFGSALLSFYAVFVSRPEIVDSLLLGLASFYVLCGLMVLVLIVATQRDHLLRVPQWILLVLIGLLMWWGASG